jgi:hypothetical protein
MKVLNANGLINEWDNLSTQIRTESVEILIGDYVYQIGQSFDDEGTNDNIWFSRRLTQDYIDGKDTHEEVEGWVPEAGSEGFDEHHRKNNFKLLR